MGMHGDRVVVAQLDLAKQSTERFAVLLRKLLDQRL